MKHISVDEGFSFVDLLAHMIAVDAQKGHMERVVLCTPSKRYILYVGIAAIEDVSPKLQVVK